MEEYWISTPHDRPRCEATDSQGQRCREPVVWEGQPDRPVSTRCEVHGGLLDAAHVGRRSPDFKESWHKIGPVTGAVNVLATSVNKLQIIDLGRRSGGLAALALAAALCLSMAGSALADFQTAVTAYERGNYQEAQNEFATLAEAGDERAVPYLEKIRERLNNKTPTDRTFMSSIIDAVAEMFGDTSPPDGVSDSEGVTSKIEPSPTGRSTGRASGTKPADREPWSPFDQDTEPVLPADSGVIVPQRESIWSRLFHLPGDTTAIGLQHVATFLAAENFSRELQSISRHSNKITLSILAGFWWIVIIRAIVGIGIAISRFMRAAAIREPKHYG